MRQQFERIYPFVPLWAQNLGLSLWGLAWKRERLGGDFEKHVAGYCERDRWTPDRMEEFLEAELQRRLVHAFEEVPYYRWTWGKAGWTKSRLAKMTRARLTELPVLPKQDVRAQPDAFVAADVARRHALHRYPTSGSTGTPVTHICTSDGHRRFVAGREVRSLGWAGTSIREPRSMIGGRMIIPRGVATPPYYRFNRAEKQVYFTAFHIAPETVSDYVEGFNRHRPQLFTGYAYSHFILGRMMLEQGLSLAYTPKALVLGSEKLTLEMKNILRQAFGARAYEEYGSVENCMLATECEHGRLHASQDFGLIEIVDAEGQPVAPGVEGRIVCTSLQNDAQPFIRYEIGDMARWSADKCPCGRDHLPVIDEIVGRLEDVVIGPDGRQMVRFHGVFLDLPHVLEGQVVQQQIDRFLVNVVTRPGFGPAEEAIIRQRFEERLGQIYVQIERVKDIPRTERGKFRSVICQIPPEHRPRPSNLVTPEPMSR